MIYELKKYTPHAGKAEALRERFVQHTLPIFRANGIAVVAAFAPAGAPEQLWYVTAFKDEAARAAGWAAFGADPQWKAVKSASEADGPLLASQTTELLAGLPGAPAFGL